MPLFNPVGYDLLASSGKLGTAAASAGVLTIDARDMLLVEVMVTGYAGNDIASLRFNGDTGTNYWYKPASTAAATTAWTIGAAGTAKTLVQLFATGVTLGRSAIVGITNNATTEKIITINGATGSGVATAMGTIESGAGGWVNTTAQITSIEMRTNGGANLLTGTGFRVFGANL